MTGVALATVPIERIEAMRDRWGHRFAARWFTETERSYCEPRRHAAQHYAARLAAKLAFRRLAGPVRLAEVEVVRDAAGAPSLALPERFQNRGRFHLSLSHDAGVAVALVVGEEADT